MVSFAEVPISHFSVSHNHAPFPTCILAQASDQSECQDRFLRCPLYDRLHCCPAWASSSSRCMHAHGLHQVSTVALQALMSPSARTAAQPPRRVLLTNDDGPDSEGSPFLRHWIEHVRSVLEWDCCVCIPASGQSFVSKSISKGPVKVQQQSSEVAQLGTFVRCSHV